MTADADDRLRAEAGAFSRFVDAMRKAVDAARLAGQTEMRLDLTEVEMLVSASAGLLVALQHSGGRKPAPPKPRDSKFQAAWIRVVLPMATFGALVCPKCGVVECAPYGRKLIGSTAASARAYLRSLERERWSLSAKVDCPRCSE